MRPGTQFGAPQPHLVGGGGRFKSVVEMSRFDLVSCYRLSGHMFADHFAKGAKDNLGARPTACRTKPNKANMACSGGKTGRELLISCFDESVEALNNWILTINHRNLDCGC